MARQTKNRKDLLNEIEALRERTEELENTLAAITRGEVDAFVVSLPSSDSIVTLPGADHPYHVVVESMKDGAVTVAPDSRILYCNLGFAGLVGIEYTQCIGRFLLDFVPKDNRAALQEFISKSLTANGRMETLISPDGTGGIPVYLSAFAVQIQAVRVVCMTVTDISELRRAEQAVLQHKRTIEVIGEHSNDIVARFDRELRHIYVSPSIERVTGIPSEAFIGKTNRDLGMRDDLVDYWNDELTKVFETGNVSRIEFCVERENKSIYYESLILPDTFIGNSIQSVMSISRNITDVKMAHAALKESELRYRSLFENSFDAILLTTPDGGVLAANHAACALFAMTEEELCRVGRDGLVDPNDPNLPILLDQRRRTGKAAGELRFRRKDDTVFVAEISSAIYEYGDGFQSNCLVIRDISSRKKMEQELAESELRYKSLFDYNPDAVFSFDLAGNFMSANKGLQSLTGYSLEELMTMSFVPIVDSEYIDVTVAAFEKAVAGDPQQYNTAGIRKDGTKFIVNVTNMPIIINGKIVGVFGIAKDITAHRLFEEEIRKLSRAVEQSPASIVITDSKGDIEYVNPKFTLLTGYSLEEVRGQNPRILKSGMTPVETYQTMWETIIRGGVWQGELLNKKKNAELYWESVTISPIIDTQGRTSHFVAIKEDITERKNLEEQLRQSQKLEAIGQLAGGVAHDFNNILSAIIGYASLLKMKMDQDDINRSSIEQILEASQRAARLTQSLLAFSRKQIVCPKQLDLNEVVREFEKMLLRLIREDIELYTRCSEGSLPIMADRGQIEQVIMNLVTNARDAMPEGGKIQIITDSLSMDSSFIAAHGFGLVGEYALMRVTDTGMGMDEKTKARIFEPFFTTKEMGKGTGLGLAMVYGIIKKHDGFITVYSELNKGTTFTVLLPLQKTLQEPHKEEKLRIEPVKGGSEVILIAEDDPALRRLTTSVLSNYGYEVIEAVDGEDALYRFIEGKNRIKLVILDGIMPKKNGMNAYKEMKQLLPDLRALFMSGYADDVFTQDGLAATDVEFLQKPVSPSVMLKKVREILDKE